MQPRNIDGIVYNKEFANSLRESCIVLRDAALSASNFDWAVSLSHVIAFITVMSEELEA